MARSIVRGRPQKNLFLFCQGATVLCKCPHRFYPRFVKVAKIKVLIVDDHAIVREGLKAVLQIDPGLTVVGEAANGKQALQMVRTLDPQVVLMDLVMPVMDGIEATRQTVAQFSN